MNPRWPGERFLWSVVEDSPWRGSGQVPPGVLAEAADDLPAPIEDLHAVGAVIDASRIIVCAIDRRELEGLDHAATSLTPEAIPPCLGVEIDPLQLNLLVGEFEPRPMRRTRLVRHIAAAGLVAAIVASIALGLARRTEHWRAVASKTRQARIELASRLAPGVPLRELPYELTRLRTIAEAASRVVPPRDAAVTLAAVLTQWPNATTATPQSISIADSLVTMTVAVEQDPSAFLANLRAPEGWQLEDPRLNAAGGTTRLSLTMVPTPTFTPTPTGATR